MTAARTGPPGAGVLMKTTLIAFLRAVNVGDTGKLPMADLRAICEKAGFTDLRTYIASGNVVFKSTVAATVAATTAKAKLEKALLAKMGKPCQVLIRTIDELAAAVVANPFPDAAPNQLIVLFLDVAPPKSALADVRTPGGERLTLVGRELFIHFPDGQGKSKLKVPFADVGTARNLNTVNALLAMAREGA